MSTFNSRVVFTKETEVVEIDGYVACSPTGAVLPCAPTIAPGALPGSGPWTRFKGFEKSIGVGTGTVQGAGIVNQPRQSTGVYQFVMDSGNPAVAFLSPSVILSNNATGMLTPKIVANISGVQGATSTQNGIYPGTDPALAPLTVQVSFYNNSGVLNDVISGNGAIGGFFISFKVKTTKA